MRVGIIGMGWVGTSVAMSVLTQGAARELYLNDVRERVAEGEAMDLAHGAPFLRSTTVRAVPLHEMQACDAVVIAAGRNGKPGESRLDLLRDNAGVVRSLGAALAGHRGLLIMVTNPVDVLTHVLLEASGLPPERVLGTGTLLDSARLRHVVGSALGVAPQSIHASVLGEHGDSQVAAFSSARVGGIPLRAYPGWQREREPAIADEVRYAAREIIARKGATNHAIGLATAHLLKWALNDERRVLTVSRLQTGPTVPHGICLSLPAIVGLGGAITVLEPTLDDDETAALARSAAVLAKAKAEISAAGPVGV
jgi:L-lactate dehydrogenase